MKHLNHHEGNNNAVIIRQLKTAHYGVGRTDVLDPDHHSPVPNLTMC